MWVSVPSRLRTGGASGDRGQQTMGKTGQANCDKETEHRVGRSKKERGREGEGTVGHGIEEAQNSNRYTQQQQLKQIHHWSVNRIGGRGV